MPAEVVFATGGSVKVMATVDDVEAALSDDSTVLDTARFAGFRGDEAVSGERIVVRVAAIAYVQAIAAQ